MAEGLFKHEAGDKFEVFSAGSYPSRLHPAAIKVMAEWGIDIEKQKSEKTETNEFISTLAKNMELSKREITVNVFFFGRLPIIVSIPEDDIIVTSSPIFRPNVKLNSLPIDI